MLTIIRRLFGADPDERAREEERQRNERRAYAAQLVRDAHISRNQRRHPVAFQLAPALSRLKR